MQLEDLTGMKADIRSFVPDDRLAIPNNYIGVELEVEGVRYGSIRPPKFWNIVEDGSLRGGLEFVLANPLMGKDLISSLELLERKCNRLRGLKYSARTSVHIHVDARDMSVEQLLNLIGLYLIFEKAIYKYHDNGYNREKNIYCLPFYKANGHLGILGGISRVLEGSGTPSKDVLRSALNNLSKYYGLNVVSLFNYGSLEFRHMEGTHSAEKILEWINILLAMKQYACEYDGHPYAILEGVSSEGYKGIINDVFGDEIADKLFNYKGADVDIYDGMQVFQDIIYATPLRKSYDRYLYRAYKTNKDHKYSENYISYTEKFKKKKKANPYTSTGLGRGGIEFGEAVPAAPRPEEWTTQEIRREDPVRAAREQLMATARSTGRDLSLDELGRIAQILNRQRQER